MVLSSPPSANTTPSDSSNAEGVLQSLYRAVSSPFSPGNGDLDATLLEEDPLLSSSDNGDMVLPTMTATPTEGYMIDRLPSVQQSDKSVGLMDSSGGLGVSDSSVGIGGVDSSGGFGGVVSNPAKFAGLAAGGDSFDDVLMEDQENRDGNGFNDPSPMAPNLPTLDQAGLVSDSRTLRNRSSLVAPRRFRSLIVPKVERRVNISGSFDVVSLLLVENIGVTICGGSIGASGSHAYVDTVIPGRTSCAVKSHNVKAKGLLEHHLYIRNSNEFIKSSLNICSNSESALDFNNLEFENSMRG